VKGQSEISLLQPDASGRVLAKGKTWVGNPSRAFLVPVQNPPAYFGSALRRVLADRNLRVTGEVRLASDSELGQPCTVVAQVTSPIAPVVTKMLKDSDNNLAEHLFKLAGATRYKRGTFATGATAVRDYLASLEIPESERRFVDGSGLSRDNRISAAGLTTVLTRAYVGPARDVFVKALPIAGIDGSLKNRMGEEPVCGRVRAKTGFINRVSALSGYVRTVSGESLAFSILMNNFQSSNSTMKELQDDLCRVLVRYSPRERTNPGG
jgi:D-alanyl-D-alanine carboxypeptidase/D-alanyl-D-alanine-endopeptidase (penicillin-binding protein 4)